ncbi:MAG: hypothetical protein ACI8W9_001917, partial [Psychromonas sp.]
GQTRLNLNKMLTLILQIKKIKKLKLYANLLSYDAI